MSTAIRRRRCRSDLTPNEVDILRYLAEGLSVPRTAQKLEVAETTIKTALRRAYSRLGARTAAHAVAIMYNQMLWGDHEPVIGEDRLPPHSCHLDLPEYAASASLIPQPRTPSPTP